VLLSSDERPEQLIAKVPRQLNKCYAAGVVIDIGGNDAGPHHVRNNRKLFQRFIPSFFPFRGRRKDISITSSTPQCQQDVFRINDWKRYEIIFRYDSATIISSVSGVTDFILVSMTQQAVLEDRPL